MKILTLFLTLICFVSCDPYGFGYKKNPAFILNEAFRAVNHQDVKSFLNVSGKEALCLYGNTEGLSYLEEKLQIDPKNIAVEPKVLTNKRLKIPNYVDGYWSYYNERYLVNINTKAEGRNLLQVVVDCDFGDEKKDDAFSNPTYKFKKFKKKACRLIKMIPSAFEPLPLPANCAKLKIFLSEDQMKVVLQAKKQD
jgi:hypothetical protein